MVRAQDIPQSVRDYVAAQYAQRRQPLTDEQAATLVRLLGPRARALVDAQQPASSRSQQR